MTSFVSLRQKICLVQIITQNYSDNKIQSQLKELQKMGSFSTKMRLIRDGGNFRKTSQEETSRGIEDEHHSITNNGETCENSPASGKADAANRATESNTTATNHEQQGAPKVGQSFSWLASSPVVLNTTTKDLKAKGKRQKETRNTNCIRKYSHAKYLNSWQQPIELPSTSMKRKQQNNASSCSAIEANNSNQTKHPKTCVNSYEKTGNRSTKQANNGDASSSRGGNLPVGFGVIEKQISHQNDSSSPWQTVRTTKEKNEERKCMFP